MGINGVIAGKLANLDRVVTNLRSLAPLSPEDLEDWILRGAVERNLQVAVEIVIDVCHRLHSLSGQAPVSSAREAVKGCVRLGALKDDSVYAKMIGFRNLVVHAYEYVEVAILLEIMNSHLSDFDTFRNEILAYVET